MRSFCRAAALAGLISLAAASALAQSGQRPWLDPAVTAAAKAEGELIVYSSTNEQEGLPLWKIFEEATGIKVSYVRGSDVTLMSRMAIEFRADQKSYTSPRSARCSRRC
jgi:spermidine/putrescine-binding protein